MIKILHGLKHALILIIILVLICQFNLYAQTITSFSPTSITAGTGSILTINGSGFGTAPSTTNFIEFTGASTSAPEVAAQFPAYKSWTDNQITVQVPSDAGTGLFYLVQGTTLFSSGTSLTIPYDMINVSYNNYSYPTYLVNHNGSGGYTFQFFTDFNSNISANQSFTRAFQTWKCATGVNWTIGSPTSVNVIADDNINVIKQTTDSNELEAGELGLTYSFYRSSGSDTRWEIVGVDIVFADISQYALNYGPAAPANNQFDFQSICLHELGHAHGLEHFNDINDVMYKYSFYGGMVRTLSVNDVNAGNYEMTLSTAAPVGTYIYPAMVAVSATNCNVINPTITSFTPKTGVAGTTITINGKNLTGATSVSFGNTAAQSFIQISDAQLTAVVGNGASGSVSVTTPGGLATDTGFVFMTAQTISFPALTSVKYGNADFSAGATSTNSTIPITYTSSNTSVATITTGGNIHIVGVGTTIITASQAGNINFIAATPVTQNLTVTPASLNVTANNQTKIYGAANPTLTFTFSGFVNGETPSVVTTIPVITTSANISSPVATYPITISGGAAANYLITYIAGVLTVTPVTLVITADNKTKTYGAANPTLTFSYSGFVNGETSSVLTTAPVITTSANVGSPVATYPITISGGAAANYLITYTAGVLTVSPAALSITADNKSRSYGVANPPLTVTYRGFVNNDNELSLLTPPVTVTTATTNSPLGNYPITVSGASSNNYAITYVAGTLTIGQSILTITADNKSKNFSDPNPPLTISYNGFTNGDSQTSLTSQPVISTTATALSPVGSYPINVSGATSPNYTIVYSQGNLVINAAPAPTVSSFSPGTSLASSTITITGTYFLNATSVSFGGVAAGSFTVNSPTGITAVVGSGASGNVTVTTPSGSGSLGGYVFVYSLPQNNFKITNKSATCIGSDNASINISAAENLNYTATISGIGISASYPFTDTLSIDNLKPGTISVCITVAGHPEFQQCYSLVISEPQPLSVNPVVSVGSQTVELDLSGGQHYYIALNGENYNTDNNSISLPLVFGTNVLKVTTDKLCQGIFERELIVSDKILAYPNPVESILNLSLGMSVLKNTSVEIFDGSGRLVYSKKYGTQSGILSFDISNLTSGVYALRLSADNTLKIFKILKQ
jgi:hypothetical protein